MLKEKKFKAVLHGSSNIIVPTPDLEYREMYKVKEKMKEAIISGVKRVSQVVISKKDRDYVIMTLGTNLKKMLEIKEVSPEKLISNDLHEVASVFGYRNIKNNDQNKTHRLGH